jgi:HdeA/HdeB family
MNIVIGKFSRFSKLALVLGFALFCNVSGPAKANVLDISAIKCADLLKFNADQLSYILVWADGFMGGKSDDTTFDLDRFEKNSNKVKELCDSSNQDTGLLTIIKQVEAAN